jgi:glycosyltransferase involved in cell wall biosynthesis
LVRSKTGMDLVEKKKTLHETSWEPAYKCFSRVINELGLKVGAEIGVAFGGHSEAILQQTDVRRLIGVDEYRHRKGYDDAMNLPQSAFDVLFERTKSRLAAYGDRFQLVRANSGAAADEIKSPLDFVYIDADHSYDGVWADLCAWFPKIRLGGVIGGHDYEHCDFPGVKEAIDKFFGRLAWTVNQAGETVWWVKKQPINISFFMPAYNCEATVTEAIESIMTTNFEPGDELIVVDDDSTDGTPQVLELMKTRYPAIKVIRHEQNRGGSAARNTAVGQAQNALLFCLDSDNILMPKSISSLKEFLCSSGADIATFSEVHYFEDDSTKASYKWQYKPGFTGLADYLCGHVHAGSSGNYMFTKESWLKVGGYPEGAGALDTWGFGLRQLANGFQMAAMPNSSYLHRQGHESYWVRDSNQRSMSRVAQDLLLPFQELIHPKDLKYLTSDKGRDVWFDRLPKRPIRLRKKQTGKSGISSIRGQLSPLRLSKLAVHKALSLLGDERHLRIKAFVRTMAKSPQR